KRRAGAGEVLMRNICGRSNSGPDSFCDGPRSQRFRQSKIEDLGLPTCGDKNVCWFDVPMNNALAVCGIQCVSDLDCQLQHRFDVQRLCGNSLLEGLPFEILHGHERRALVLPEVENRANIRMVKR